MANILICTVGVLSHINTQSGVAKRLTQAGHIVTFLVQRATHIGVLQAQGYEIFCTAPNAESNESPTGNNVHYQTQPFDCIRHAVPDLLMVDAEWHEVILYALTSNRRIVGLEYHCSPDRWANVPPLSSGYIPRAGILSRARSYAEWLRALNRRKQRGVVTKQLDQLSQTLNIAPKSLASMISLNHWQPVRFKDIEYFCLSTELFDYPHAKRGDSTYIGPCIDNARFEETGDAEFEAWFERSLKNSKPERFIYASLSSMASNAAWIQAIVEAARAETRWTWLLSANDDSGDGIFPHLPSNIYVTRSVPQLRVLKHADVMLAGAGIGTIHECIITLTPIVAHSLGMLDQEGNAARVLYSGIGQRARPGNTLAAGLIDRIDVLAANEQHAHSLARLKASIDKYDDKLVLEHQVKRILERSPGDTRGRPE